jgi:hypothetical protein
LFLLDFYSLDFSVAFCGFFLAFSGGFLPIRWARRSPEAVRLGAGRTV